MEDIINKIALADFNDKITCVNGYCGLEISIDANYSTPVYQKGVLRVEHNRKDGITYGISDKDFPVHINRRVGLYWKSTNVGTGDRIYT